MRVIAVAASGSTRYAQIGEDVDSNTGGDVGRDARASPAGFFCPRLARLYLCLRPYLYGWPLPLKLPLMVVSDPDPGSTTRIPTDQVSRIYKQGGVAKKQPTDCPLQPGLSLLCEQGLGTEVPKANPAPKPGRLVECLASSAGSETRRVSFWRLASSLGWKETLGMKGGITGRLQEAKLRRLDKLLIECRLLSEVQSQVSESARAFSKNPAPMGIRPGRPSLAAEASWALPRSPIRCLDVSYTPRGATWAYGLALPFDLSSRVTRNAQ
ncbi:hypothetical protein AAC387_Pa02g2494 [Persea americana]